MSQARVVALSGGIGGAKLALGLYHTLPRQALCVVVNTGDDFAHLGLSISPDLDTVLYTLAGLDNPDTGWGRRDETWTFMHTLETLGGETWFQLGDGDLALHVERTRRLQAGESLSAIMADVARRWSVAADILPMSDDPLRTIVETDQGTMPFQEYFVARHCAPRVMAIRFDGAAAARPHPDVMAALYDETTEAIVIGPSNPYLSIDPILAMPQVRAALAKASVPVVAVAPIVGGRAIKGPTAKIMTEIGLPVSAAAIAAHYDGLIDGFVLDRADAALAGEIAVPTLVTNTVMVDRDDKIHLAKAVVDFARDLSAAGEGRRASS
jgi:LPPG:FO 2-phospho-L-lactate transferase